MAGVQGSSGTRARCMEAGRAWAGCRQPWQAAGSRVPQAGCRQGAASPGQGAGWRGPRVGCKRPRAGSGVTLEEGGDVPGGDAPLLHELPQGHLQEEDGDAAHEDDEQVGDEEDAWGRGGDTRSRLSRRRRRPPRAPPGPPFPPRAARPGAANGEGASAPSPRRAADVGQGGQVAGGSPRTPTPGGDTGHPWGGPRVPRTAPRAGELPGGPAHRGVTPCARHGVESSGALPRAVGCPPPPDSPRCGALPPLRGAGAGAHLRRSCSTGRGSARRCPTPRRNPRRT